MTISGTGAAPKSSALQAALDQLNSIIVSDGAHSQTLYFGSSGAGLDPRMLAMPPATPGPDALDVRFTSGRIAELLPRTLSSPASLPIDVRAAAASVTVVE